MAVLESERQNDELTAKPRIWDLKNTCIKIRTSRSTTNFWSVEPSRIRFWMLISSPTIELKNPRLKFKMREEDTNEVKIRFSQELLKSWSPLTLKQPSHQELVLSPQHFYRHPLRDLQDLLPLHLDFWRWDYRPSAFVYVLFPSQSLLQAYLLLPVRS